MVRPTLGSRTAKGQNRTSDGPWCWSSVPAGASSSRRRRRWPRLGPTPRHFHLHLACLLLRLEELKQSQLLPTFTAPRHNHKLLLQLQQQWLLHRCMAKGRKVRDIAVSNVTLPHCYSNSHAILDHQPAEVTLPPLPQPAEAGTRFSNPRGMQGWVDRGTAVKVHHKAAYRSGRHDIHNHLRWDSNPGPLTLQSDAITTWPPRPVNRQMTDRAFFLPAVEVMSNHQVFIIRLLLLLSSGPVARPLVWRQTVECLHGSEEAISRRHRWRKSDVTRVQRSIVAVFQLPVTSSQHLTRP